MRKLSLLLMLLSIFVITSCNTVPVLQSKIEIRLENVSEVTLDNLTLDGIEYGTLKAGKTSDYQTFEYFHAQSDYIMAYSNATVDNQEVTNDMMIFCGTGLESLPSGKYTIEVDYEILEEGRGRLSLHLKE